MILQSAERLDNTGVLVTRPAHQNQPFIDLLLNSGAQPIAFPTIAISDTDNISAAESRIASLDQYHLLIFISANAVEYGVKLIKNLGKHIHQPVSAIGKGTAQTLQQHNIPVNVQPAAGFNSEAFLALDEVQEEQISGKKVLIFRGQDGRELLANTLKSRGAEVDYVEVYRRCPALSDIEPVLELWAQNRIQIITVTSNESLKNLYDMTSKRGRDYLCQTPLVVPGERCAELAQKLGFKIILLATSATDQAMLDRIRQWHKSTNALE